MAENKIIKSPKDEMPTTDKESFSKKVSRMLGFGLDSWNNVMIGSLAAGALAAVVVVLSQWVIIRLQGEEAVASAEAFARYKLETEEKITEARKETASAKLELAKITTPRWKLLTADAEASIVGKLLPFAGTKFDVGHARNGREQWDLLWHLEKTFFQAKWEFVDWNGVPRFTKINWTRQPHAYGEANVSNVSIELDPTQRDRLLPAATGLSTALNDVGIATVIEDAPINAISGTSDAIHILVGTKE
jgi:hypothetical protein